MAIHLGKDDDRCKLMIDGRFTFDTYREFLSAIQDRSKLCSHLTIDLTRTEYLDSSALGLLIQMRERLSSPEKTCCESRKAALPTKC